MVNIPTPEQRRHPHWCAGEPLCTAYDDAEKFAAMRQHRGPVFTVSVAGLDIDLRLQQSAPGWPTDAYLTAVARMAAGQAGLTLSINAGWQLLDAASGLLEQVR